MEEDFGTISLVPATKKIGENATSFRRWTLPVVEPHSRSISPDAIFCRRLVGVTGANAILISMPSSSADASSTIPRQRSIEYPIGFCLRWRYEKANELSR